MKITGHLHITNRGSVRYTKGRSSVDANEISFQINIEVPDAIFRRPYPVIDIKLPNWTTEPDIDVVMDISSRTVAEAIQVNVSDVRDGLDEAIKRAQGEES